MDNADAKPNEANEKITEFSGVCLNKRVIEKVT